MDRLERIRAYIEAYKKVRSQIPLTEPLPQHPSITIRDMEWLIELAERHNS